MKISSLVLLLALSLIACEKEVTQEEKLSWAGDWVASMVLRDGVLTEIPSTINGFDSLYMNITIEDGDNGILGGNTFNNFFGIEFWLSPNNQVEFGTIEGTRAQEQVWGGAVLGNIMKTKRYEVEKDSLHFKDLDKNTLIIFVKPQ